MSRKLNFLLLSFLVWRILLFTPLIIAGKIIPYRQGQDFTNILKYAADNLFIRYNLIFPWANFDGVHYLNIAFRGYMNEARFFPLFPGIIFAASYILGLGKVTYELVFWMGVFLPNLFFLASLYILYKLLRLDYPLKIIREVIFFVLIFPTSFFFVSVYSESLFLLLLLLSFYFARAGKWNYSLISAFLLVITRIVGVFIIPALIYEYLEQKGLIKSIQKINKEQLFLLFKIVILTPLGLIIYSIFNYQKWCSDIYFITAHSLLGNNRSSGLLIFPFQTIFRYIKIFTSISYTRFEWQIALLELTSFVFGSLLLYISWRKNVRKSYLIFSIPAFLLPVLSGTFSGLPRYILVLFPVFIALSLIKNHFFKMIYSVVSFTLLFVLLMFFSRGYYIS